jgi:hypothetical protein
MEDLMRSIPETPSAPTTQRRYANALAAWPLRKRMAVGLIAPVLFVLMVATSGGWAPATSPGWTALVSGVAFACATTLATYLPRPGIGLRPDLGCTPCAAVAAVTVLASFGLLSSAPQDVSTAVLALGVSAFGLVQRLKDPSTCPA